MSNLAIDIKHLTKVFGEKAVVHQVTLQVQRGSVFGFLGSNGSGKTTMIRMLCGLLTPTSGEGHCLGYDIKTDSLGIKMHVGYMPQKFSLYNGLTVYENLQFFATIYQISKSKEAIKAIVNDLQLEPYLSVRALHLSGGWKQRLALACCLLHRPKLLFLDEPTAGVDPLARKEFWNYLHKIALRDGTTILITTHYMDEAEKCTDLAYIHLGHLLYAGATEHLISFSQVQTDVVLAPRARIVSLNEALVREFPDVLIALVNNDLRVSSRHKERIKACRTAFSDVKFKAVTPSFEEVFIGLMQP